MFQHDVIFKFSWRCFVFLVKFSYWSKFHVNIITGSGVMTISFYKVLTRNLEIGNTPVWVFPNIWRLEQVRNTKFGTNISNKMLLNAAKCQGLKFYRFWVIEENRGSKITLPLTPRNLYQLCTFFCLLSRILEIKEIYPNSKFIMLWLMMNFFLRNDWLTKGALPSSRDHYQILTIAILRHATSKTGTCAEPKFRLCWMKLCCSDKHYTKRPRLFPETGLV